MSENVEGQRLMLILLAISSIVILLVPSSLPLVTAFKVSEQAMCRQIEFKTLACGERTSAFLLTDRWIFFWFRANFEKSDDRSTAEITFSDPNGTAFAKMTGTVVSQASPGGISPLMVADMVIWMGVGVNEAYAQGGFILSPSSVDPEQVQRSSADVWEQRDQAHLLPSAYHYLNITFLPPPPHGYAVWVAKINQPAGMQLGDWRADFTLDSKAVVSERFSLGRTITTTTAPPAVTAQSEVEATMSPSVLGFSSNSLIVGSTVAIAVVITALGVYIYVRGRMGRHPNKGDN